MSPIPILVPGILSTASSNQPLAFFDTAANQVLIQIPPLTAGALAAQTRYDIPNRAHPTLASSVGSAGSELLQYTYSLTDSSAASQVTDSFQILVPSDDESLSATPGAWSFSKSATSLPDRSSTATLGTMTFVSWENLTSSAGKPSILTVALTSKYLPGIGDAFVAGKTPNPLTPSVIASLPLSLKQQLKDFVEPAIAKAPYMVIGPLFKQATSKSVIAANYRFGVAALIHGGAIDAASPYANALIAALSAFLESGGSGKPVLPSVPPASAIERAISNAAAIALQ
jgi:hypothetical protein